MKRIGTVFLGTFLLASSAYAATFSERDIAARLSNVEQRLNQMPSSGGGAQDGSAAGIQVQIDELREQLRKINGKLEENAHRMTQLENQMQAMAKDNEFRFQALEQAAPVANAPAAAQAATSAPTASAASTTTAAPVATAATPTPAFASSKEHYNYAFSLMNKAQYAEAGEAFASFVKTYPQDPLVGNVYYWLGETWYVRGDFVKSADSFRQGFEAMPKGNKAPDNLLKLAMSLGKMKQQKQACVVLSQLLKKFDGPEIVRGRATREQEQQGCGK